MVTEILLPFALFSMMASMGMSLLVDDFRAVVAYPRAAIVGIASMLLIVPTLGFAVAHWSSLPPALAVGVVLVATCPGGIFSNLFTDLGRGNLALSVSLTIVVSLAYVFTIPFWAALALRAFGGELAEIDLPFAQTLTQLSTLVLLPVALGMLVRAYREAFAKRWVGRVKTISAVLVAGIFIYLGFSQSDTVVANTKQVFLPVLILNLSAVAFATVLALVVRLQRRDAFAVIVEHAIRQEGTAIFVAATLIGNTEMTLPLLVNASIGGAIATAVFVLLAGNRPLLVRVRDFLWTSKRRVST